MKKLVVWMFFLFAGFIAMSQENMILLHLKGNTVADFVTDEIDSVKLSQGYMKIYLNAINDTIVSVNPIEIPVSEIDSITFGSAVYNGNVVYVFFDQDHATIINPFVNNGVTVTSTDGKVSVNSTTSVNNIVYHLSGNSTNGSFTIESQEAITLELSNLSLTNSTGSAININKNISAIVDLSGVNYISDSTGSSQNATFLSKGSLDFQGGGSLEVKGYKKHAISSNGQITLNNGNVNITQSNSDGFHSEGFIMHGGTINISASESGDAIDAGGGMLIINNGSINIVSAAADVKGMKADDTIIINGGTINMNVSGNQSKAIKSSTAVIFHGGITTMTLSGDVVLEASGNGYDPSYCTGVKSDGNILFYDGSITINSLAASRGGKGFSADGDIVIEGGNVNITTAGAGAVYTNDAGVTDSYTACCIKSDMNMYLFGGNITCSSSGSGGKGISSDGSMAIGQMQGIIYYPDSLLILNVSTSGERFYVSGSRQGQNDNTDYANPKAIKSEGRLVVSSGIINIVCTGEGGEGLESKDTLVIDGGIIDIQTKDDCVNAANHIAINGGYVHAISSGNDGFDSNGTLEINGGFTLSAGTKGAEEGFDCDQNQFAIRGGTAIGTGGATSNPTASACTQRTMKYNSATAGQSICIKNAATNEVVLLYTIPAYSNTVGGPGGQGGNSAVMIFTSPDLITGNYTLQYGGTITGGTTINGYNTGGTYTGGNSKSFTISNTSSMLITVN
ncbi:MAG: carbohydrate-binding domain-containing protein [Bacteroidales bacterium]|jgi:hypothetical protein|nr:carbohydrate-binding domain-containing protein [Bacteroidales bacterium]